MHENKNYFAKNLEKLIEKNGIKKVDLANKLGVKKSCISNYLAGRLPKRDTIIDIATFFGVSFEQLIKADIENPVISLQESDMYVSTIPLFYDQLISEQVIYRRDNFQGNIASPVFLPKDSEYYAVMVHDDLMKESGISDGSIVVFDSAAPPDNGNIAAVFIKSKKTIVIRRVLIEKNKLTLVYGEKCDEYKITRDECDAMILGNVVSATFNPNTK